MRKERWLVSFGLNTYLVNRRVGSEVGRYHNRIQTRLNWIAGTDALTLFGNAILSN